MPVADGAHTHSGQAPITRPLFTVYKIDLVLLRRLLDAFLFHAIDLKIQRWKPSKWVQAGRGPQNQNQNQNHSHSPETGRQIYQDDKRSDRSNKSTKAAFLIKKEEPIGEWEHLC